MKTLPWILVVAFLASVFSTPVRAQEDPPPPDPQEEGDAEGAGATPEGETPENETPENETPENETQPPEAVLPDADFGKEASRAEFDKAKGFYAQGKFKEAEALFKKLKADGKTKDDKDLLERWARGAGGSIILEKVRARVKAKQFQQALKEAEDYSRVYAGTPAQSGFLALVQEIEAQLFVVLESFNSPSASYSEKFGKTFVKDAKLWLDGTLCLRWASTKERDNVTLKIKSPPVSQTDWTRIEAVEFWVYVVAAPTEISAVIGCGDVAASAKRKEKAKAAGTKKKKKAGDEATGHYLASVRFPAGAKKWQKVRIPMNEFKSQGEADLKGVLYFQLQVGEGRAFDFLIDKIALQRKAGAGAGAETKK